MNLVLGGAEETVNTIDISEDGQALPARVRYIPPSCIHKAELTLAD
jgi:hypothetical protein